MNIPYGYLPMHTEQFNINRVCIFKVYAGEASYVTYCDASECYVSHKVNTLADGWCVAWFEHGMWKISGDEHCSLRTEECRLFIDEYKAQGLAARLMFGLPPEEDEYDWFYKWQSGEGKHTDTANGADV